MRAARDERGELRVDLGGGQAQVARRDDRDVGVRAARRDEALDPQRLGEASAAARGQRLHVHRLLDVQARALLRVRLGRVRRRAEPLDEGSELVVHVHEVVVRLDERQRRHVDRLVAAAARATVQQQQRAARRGGSRREP